MMWPPASRNSAPAATSRLTSRSLRCDGDLEDRELAQFLIRLQGGRRAVHRRALPLLVVRGLELDHRADFRETAEFRTELPVEVGLVGGVAAGGPDSPLGDHQ